MIGSVAYSAEDPRRWALYLLNNILGGPGLNSRLNLTLREHNGLVYSVESTMVCYSDTGIWSVYFGCDQHDVRLCRRLVRRELKRLMRKPLSPTQLQNAKRQLQGQLAIASDSREQFALDFAKNFLHTGTQRDLTDIMRHIDQLTADDLQRVANEMFSDERLTTLIYT
jgi:predicted Zn-dependent peptidase